MTTESQMVDRAKGALLGGALGDALGMPTQLMSPQAIHQTYGRVTGFVAPTEDHPVSRGLPPGMVTDDTEQSLLLARFLLRDGSGFDHALWAEKLLAWEADVTARGSYDLLGPSTKRAIDAIRAGTPPEEAGSQGDTNGAAMRIAPLGILVPAEPVTDLVARVAETCRSTHNTGLAIAAAAAVAVTVSAGVAGAGWREAVDQAVEAARLGARHGHGTRSPDIAARIGWARELVRRRPEVEALRLVADLVGTGVASQESVPCAFALLELSDGDPWRAAIHAANLGGDSDTIGAIAAGMAGACSGASRLPQDKVAALRGIDTGEVHRLARGLVAARWKMLRPASPAGTK